VSWLFQHHIPSIRSVGVRVLQKSRRTWQYQSCQRSGLSDDRYLSKEGVWGRVLTVLPSSDCMVDYIVPIRSTYLFMVKEPQRRTKKEDERKKKTHHFSAFVSYLLKRNGLNLISFLSGWQVPQRIEKNVPFFIYWFDFFSNVFGIFLFCLSHTHFGCDKPIIRGIIQIPWTFVDGTGSCPSLPDGAWVLWLPSRRPESLFFSSAQQLRHVEFLAVFFQIKFLRIRNVFWIRIRKSSLFSNNF
jgi:hypothetical protein